MEKALIELLDLYNNSSSASRFFLRQSAKVIPYGKIESHVPKEGKILDFGCGHGLFANLLSLNSSKRDVIGCDIDRHKIAIAEKTIQTRKNIHFYKQNVMNISGKFVCVAMISVLYLIPYEKQEQILQHLIDLLTDNGRLIIVEFDKTPRWKYYWVYFRESLMTSLYTKSEGLYCRSSSEYATLLSGLTLKVKTYPLNMPLYPSVVHVCTK